MANDSTTLDIFILDKAYKISCPASEQDSLRRAALHLDRKMREIRGSGKVLALERIAVIAALNISHELLSLQQQAAGQGISPQDVAALMRRIEQATLE